MAHPSQTVAKTTLPSMDPTHLRGILVGLRSLPDPRSRCTYPLNELLFTLLCGLVCGCDSYLALDEFAQGQREWLSSYVTFAKRTPSHDTFRYTLSLLKPQLLINLLSKCAPSLAGKHTRIDGKVSRGAKDPETGESRLHLLRAWIGEWGLSVGMVACAEKSNEASALPQLLDSLQLAGSVVTIDAMAGHDHVAQHINKAGGEWILALKGNEKEAFNRVKEQFRNLGQGPLPEGVEPAEKLHPPEVAPLQWPAECSRHHTEEKNRGRYESREVISIPIGEWFPKACFWYGIKSATCVIRRVVGVRHAEEMPTFEAHYYLSSLEPEAPKHAQYIRAHWGIENSCHHLLDVTWGEDQCQVRDKMAAHNLSILRELATALLNAHPAKGSVANKRQRAAFSHNFRSSIIQPLADHILHT